MDRVESFNEYRPLLISIAYRMLGTSMDAEDIVQEAFLRWQQSPDTEIQSPKAYLSSIVTRLSIDHLRSAQVQRESYIGPWLPEPLLSERTITFLDTAILAESLSMAFLVLLESLSPIERAVFLLRKVFDFEYNEIAHIVDKSEANCRQIVKRAQDYIESRRPRFDVQPEQRDRLLMQFMQTCMSGDFDGLLNLLSDDITLWSDGGGKASAALNVIKGPEKVVRAMQGFLKKMPQDLVYQMATINGQPGVIMYLDGRPYTVMILDFAPDGVRSF
jgi:RNA polymerase sigma-70 factor (ECF subfamily)